MKRMTIKLTIFSTMLLASSVTGAGEPSETGLTLTPDQMKWDVVPAKWPCVILGIGWWEGEAPVEPIAGPLRGSAGASPSQHRAR